MQFASDLASDLRFKDPFHSKQIRQTHDSGLLWSQSMAPNLCFQKRQPSFAHNFNKKTQLAIQFFHYRFSIFPLQVGAFSRAYFVTKSNKFPFATILVRDQWMLLCNPWKIIWLADESNIREWSDSFSLWETNGPPPERASEADHTGPFHSISRGSDVRLPRPVRGWSDAR